MTANSEEESPVQRAIDHNLKRIFDQTAQEPLPKQLTDLLEQLKAKEGGK